MANNAPTDMAITPQASNQSGGINIDSEEVSVRGDVVGRDKVTQIEQHVVTSGGAYINGNADVREGGKIVGRDEIIDNSVKIVNSPGAVVVSAGGVLVQPVSAARGATVEDYRDAMLRYCADLPYLTPHSIRRAGTLEVYVPLMVRRYRGDDRSLRIDQMLRQSDPKSDPPHRLIIGEPGAGKSMLLGFVNY